MNAQNAARQVSSCSDQVAQRTQAQIKDFTASVSHSHFQTIQPCQHVFYKCIRGASKHAAIPQSYSGRHIQVVVLPLCGVFSANMADCYLASLDANMNAYMEISTVDP